MPRLYTRDALPLLAYTLGRLWDNETYRIDDRFEIRGYEELALVRDPRFALRPGSVEAGYLKGCESAQRERQEAERKEREHRVRDAERIAEEQKKIARMTRIGFVVALILLIAASAVGWIAWTNAS